LANQSGSTVQSQTEEGRSAHTGFRELRSAQTTKKDHGGLRALTALLLEGVDTDRSYCNEDMPSKNHHHA